MDASADRALFVRTFAAPRRVRTPLSRIEAAARLLHTENACSARFALRNLLQALPCAKHSASKIRSEYRLVELVEECAQRFDDDPGVRVLCVAAIVELLADDALTASKRAGVLARGCPAAFPYAREMFGHTVRACASYPSYMEQFLFSATVNFAFQHFKSIRYRFDAHMLSLIDDITEAIDRVEPKDASLNMIDCLVNLFDLAARDTPETEAAALLYFESLFPVLVRRAISPPNSTLLTVVVFHSCPNALDVRKHGADILGLAKDVFLAGGAEKQGSHAEAALHLLKELESASQDEAIVREALRVCRACPDPYSRASCGEILFSPRSVTFKTHILTHEEASSELEWFFSAVPPGREVLMILEDTLTAHYWDVPLSRGLAVRAARALLQAPRDMDFNIVHNVLSILARNAIGVLPPKESALLNEAMADEGTVLYDCAMQLADEGLPLVFDTPSSSPKKRKPKNRK